MEAELEKIRHYISRGKWSWAKTYISCPHEYIIRGSSNNNLTRDEFFDFIKTIKSQGVNEWFGKRLNQYLYVDGYKYWTMGDGVNLEVDKTINRQKVFSEFDNLTYPIKVDYTENELKTIVDCILVNFNCPIFEIGFGNGGFVKTSKVKPENYYGIEPSAKAVKYFRENVKGFYRRCSRVSFEESVDKWKTSQNTIIALFGSASYIMGQYLKILKESPNDYFLMFYKKGYCPENLKEMHHFDYSKEALAYSFNSAYVMEFGNYYIVSSKDVKIKPIINPIQNELFPI